MPNRYKHGDVIDSKYTVAGPRLGAGGMGAVLRVRSVADGREYALKYCTATASEHVRRFNREIRAMEMISHPHVVQILDHNTSHIPPYFVMPLARNSLLSEVATLSQDHISALEAFLDLCTGITEVHRIGPHRDIKPDNALRMQNNKIAIADFGLIKIDARDTSILTATGHLLGTRLYMAPEQRTPGGARDADTRVDVYALGATLYHLVTGKYPAVINTTGLRPTLARIIARATKEDADDRYQTVAELAHDVSGYLAILKKPTDPQLLFSTRFESLVKQLNETGQYREEHLLELLQAIPALLENPATLIAEVDRIPDSVIQLSVSKYPDAFTIALEAYAVATSAAKKGRPYSYGERVSARMKRIFLRSESSALRALAVKVILILAVDLNRYVAMDILENVLLSIDSDSDAEAVANVLREEHARFKSQAARYRTANLHRLLRRAVMEAIAEA